jgi:hypothetical protein
VENDFEIFPIFIGGFDSKELVNDFDSDENKFYYSKGPLPADMIIVDDYEALSQQGEEPGMEAQRGKGMGRRRKAGVC